MRRDFKTMDARKIVVLLPLLILSLFTSAQVIGFRLAANSGLLLSEFGTSDVPHPTSFLSTPPQSTDHFTPQPTVGIEGEILFQISPSSFFGIEVDYTHLKGFNDNPPYYNYYLTPYFQDFQEGYYQSAIKYNTHLWNLAVNYKHFLFKEKTFQPFVKLTGVVAFVGTDLQYKDFSLENLSPDIDWNLIDYSINEGDDILYSRGTSNSEQKKWPVFHFGGGLGFSYDLSDRMAFQVDGTMTVVNSGIVDGVPNFTYAREGGQDLLRYNRRLSLTTQISVGIVYFIEVESGGTGGGRTSPERPFYRKKN